MLRYTVATTIKTAHTPPVTQATLKAFSSESVPGSIPDSDFVDGVDI